MDMKITSEKAMLEFGRKLGSLLSGGEVIELIGDVGAGKTTLVKGIAEGLLIDETVQSPSFTISRVYDCRDGLTLAHYDFYRLNDAGIMRQELSERLLDSRSIEIVEWGESVGDILPTGRISIRINFVDESSRVLNIIGDGVKSLDLMEKLNK